MSESAKNRSSQAPMPARHSRRAAGERIIGQASAIFLRAGFKDAGFLLHWPAIAGAHIARVAQPVKWQESAGGAAAGNAGGTGAGAPPPPATTSPLSCTKPLPHCCPAR